MKSVICQYICANMAMTKIGIITRFILSLCVQPIAMLAIIKNMLCKYGLYVSEKYSNKIVILATIKIIQSPTMFSFCRKQTMIIAKIRMLTSSNKNGVVNVTTPNITHTDVIAQFSSHGDANRRGLKPTTSQILGTNYYLVSCS